MPCSVRSEMAEQNLKTEIEKQEFMKDKYLCDIDEVYEIRNMSIDTLQDFIKFITNESIKN